MNSTTRRTFIQTSALSALSAGRAWGSNDRINVAIVGVGGRGQAHIHGYAKQPDAHIYALCDVDQANLERSLALVKKLTGQTPKAYKDMRDVFAEKEVNAVSMPLPNHWHALATIWACQAGKDVYIEKPACHDPYEGRQMVAAARKYGRMVQVGSQGRSADHKIRAVQLLQEGIIGQVYMAKGLCFKRRKSIGHTPNEPVPAGVDWDKFRGPAPMIPFSKNHFLYNWHWFWVQVTATSATRACTKWILRDGVSGSAIHALPLRMAANMFIRTTRKLPIHCFPASITATRNLSLRCVVFKPERKAN